ncbi:DUF4209 domain-containing protein [Acinetobacter sp. ANC 4973]|uniref:DUF4209 domain-containing protein n=1 Tax=Acinetobacter sp. ANC 4973 TaxID=1977871 RepID=UPI000A354FFB|nr:DUF4209 domain-containing protein [Acinetobacter sp. ANC 4973]OTG99463.1 hypothetical protein B9T30_08170 [Acinetobacter sp. ANC 4973]
MKDSIQLNRQLFIECEWIYEVPQEHVNGYHSIMSSLENSAKKMDLAGKKDCSKALSLLARATSMRLIADSLNEPFVAYYINYQEGKRTTILEDFTSEELTFFEDILNDVNEPYLKARLADLLWLLKQPRNPNHAIAAIDSYIANIIDDELWHHDVKISWERAALLCIQIRDMNRLDDIKQKLFSAFQLEYPSSKFMELWIAQLLDKLKIDKDFREAIALSLFRKAGTLRENEDFHSAISYFELASKKYQQCADEEGFIRSLISIAECYELEADSRIINSNMVANSFYENAIQAYRRIPNKHRDTYGLESKILEIRTKITKSGQAAIGEMTMISTPKVNISDMVELSINHVTGKHSSQEALMYFAGFEGANYENLVKSAKESIQSGLISSMFSGRHMSDDGRVVARTPAMNLSAGDTDPTNLAALDMQIQTIFSIQVQLAVEGQILPALRQLCKEHRFTKELMVAICHASPLVPKNRTTLLGHALWLGFEEEFGSAIHLLCPQVEHIVRSKLKEAGAHTSNIDRDGIENENGLSTLMELPEATQIFGKDLTFEIKSLFTEALGFNLRNKVAHGLLDDDTATSLASIYAWWMILKLIIHSIINSGIKKE